MQHLDLISIALFLTLASWDTARRFLADRREARKELAQRTDQVLASLIERNAELVELKQHLLERDNVRSEAMKAAIKQFAELIQFSDEARKAAQLRTMNKALK